MWELSDKDKRKRVIFGAGKWGVDLVELLRKASVGVDFFCDNNSGLWGKTIEEIPVISPTQLKGLGQDAEIVIMSKYAGEIYADLKKLGIEKQIVKVYSQFWEAVADCFPLLYKEELCVNRENDSNERTLFFLSNGLTLGGVETWAINECTYLNSKGIKSNLVYEKGKNDVLKAKNIGRIYIQPMDDISHTETVLNVIKDVVCFSPSVVISNFAGESAGLAFATKRIMGEKTKCVAVIHNDEEVYYASYLYAKDDIDYCVTISNRIKVEMLERGFPSEKILSMNWNLNYDETYVRLKRNKNQKLRLGYAGRITKAQKRLDYLETFVEQLKDKDVDFVISLAGDGDYLDELMSVVQNKRWNDYIKFCGIVDSEEISEFWKNQDVMISFSEHEGHSISQCEAMSLGAVPVLTDVSGVRDDVTDGEEGFVVPVGNISMMVDAIVKLDSDRDLLYKMSNNARERIKKEHTNNPSIWEKIL